MNYILYRVAIHITNTINFFLEYIGIEIIKKKKKEIGDKIIKIKDIDLIVDSSDSSGKNYSNRNSHEEYVSPLYDKIATYLDPKLVIDIGANYGFTGLIFAKRFPRAKIILVEASPHLCNYIKRNFEAIMINKYQVIPALCGETVNDASQFSINPMYSQDNRVIGLEGWNKIHVPAITLSKIIEDSYVSGNIFIKIDVQGFEKRVFDGASEFFSKHDNWLIKTEFAPQWLISQGTNPLDFLHYLINNFTVIEAPARTRFSGEDLNILFSKSLSINDSENFLSYIKSLDEHDRGWCDLLIKPKTSN